MWGQTLLGFAFSPPRARCVDGLASEPCATLGHEQPRQVVLPRSKVALDGSALVASNRVLDGLRLPLRRATHNLDRLRSSWLRRIWMASLIRKPYR